MGLKAADEAAESSRTSASKEFYSGIQSHRRIQNVQTSPNYYPDKLQHSK
jgi:hypothetical protein